MNNYFNSILNKLKDNNNYSHDLTNILYPKIICNSKKKYIKILKND